MLADLIFTGAKFSKQLCNIGHKYMQLHLKFTYQRHAFQ